MKTNSIVFSIAVIELFVASDVFAQTGQGARGYIHRLETSEFALGTGAKSAQLGTQLRFEGPWGVKAVDSRTGSFLAVPSSGAPCLSSDWKGSAKEHEDLAVTYFKKAGIPQDQILGFSVVTEMGVDEGEEDRFTPAPRLISYSTHIDRQVEGIPVPNSRMWVSFNQNSAIRSEGVFWPEIPSSTLAKAKAIQANLNSADKIHKFHTRLISRRSDVKASPGHVAIFHSDPTFPGPVQFVAAYEAISQGKKPHSILFDENGLELPSLDEKTEPAQESPSKK